MKNLGKIWKVKKQATYFLVILILTLPMIHDFIKYRYAIGDIFISNLMYPFITIDTQWSDNFSETQFRKIEAGFSKSDVKRLLGSPLVRDCNKGDCFWQ